MLFELCSNPSNFQLLKERVLQGLLYQCVLVYLDDIIVFSKNYTEHLTHLVQVFQQIQAQGLKLKPKPKKCDLLKKEIRCLGHEVSPEGVDTDPEQVYKVYAWNTSMDI